MVDGWIGAVRRSWSLIRPRDPSSRFGTSRTRRAIGWRSTGHFGWRMERLGWSSVNWIAGTARSSQEYTCFSGPFPIQSPHRVIIEHILMAQLDPNLRWLSRMRRQHDGVFMLLEIEIYTDLLFLRASLRCNLARTVANIVYSCDKSHDDQSGQQTRCHPPCPISCKTR